MKKLLTLFVSTVMLFPSLFANEKNLKVETLTALECPADEQSFQFSITNEGEDFDGKIALMAKPVGSDEEYVLFEGIYDIPAEGTYSDEIALDGMQLLPVGVYEFYFQYETEGGLMVEIPSSRYKSKLLAPTDVTKIPITTVKYERLTVYPNPALDNTTISTDLSSFRSVSVYDAKGMQVMGQEVEETKKVKLDLNRLSQGNYIIKVETEEGVVSKVMNVKK